MVDVDEIERALTGAIEKRILEGSGKLSKITTIDGVVQVTFLDVTDDANVFDTLSGALLDLRLIQASRYGSLSAHEFANRRAQTCDVIAKLRELGGAICLEPPSPIIDFPLGLFLRVTITLLKEAEQFGIFAFDEFNVLIIQFAPLPLNFAFQLAPATFEFVPVHGAAPFVAPLLQPAFKLKRSAIDSFWRRLGAAA